MMRQDQMMEREAKQKTSNCQSGVGGALADAPPTLPPGPAPPAVAANCLGP